MTTEENFAIAESEFVLEYSSEFFAGNTKNFPEFLEELKKAAASIPLTDEVLSATADRFDSVFENMFAITLRIRTNSWFSGGDLLNETITEIFSAAKAVEYGVYDTALERWQKSQNERLVTRMGSNTRTIQETV